MFGAVAPVFLAGLAAVNVGIAAAAQQAAIEHAAARKYPGGDTLAEIQSVQHALAALDMTTRAARLVVRAACRSSATCATRAGAVMAPTNGVLRTWIGKALAGLPVP